ncbi:hypothetical protein DSO57_1016385 [Entomophthora muscae]|uniref:Uncharacterized protein n=1 Tax=Entomophthora muscae TaxID=34485 RepID=A0ACC2S6P0_9FUNG|nr:hypothetical protein DSO57_1016385 [Entomophthora muscae]
MASNYPVISVTLWGIHAGVEGRGMAIVYYLKVGTKQENYGCILKIVEREVQKIILEEQEAKPALAGRLPRDLVSLTWLKDPKLARLGFEAAQSIISGEAFGWGSKDATPIFAKPALGRSRPSRIFTRCAPQPQGSLRR